MTTTEFLFSFTFVFGVVFLLSHTKIFTKNLETFTEALLYVKPSPFIALIGYWVFYGSLFYQAFFLAKFFNII